jgi:Fe2+ transport system protein B
MATAAVLLKELRSPKYLVLVIVYELLIAYLLAFFSYQIFALLFG